MNFLSKELEETLTRVNNYCALHGKWDLNCSCEKIDKCIIDALIGDKYVKNECNNNSYGLYLLSPTQKGKEYCKNKEKYIKEQRKSKIIEWVRYAITTIIALAALIISIFK